MTQILLNEKQQYAYNCIKAGKSIFLTGPGGTGKSTIIKLFSGEYSCSRKIGLTALTGCAALLLGGSTLHYYLGIQLGTAPVKNLEISIRKNRKLLSRWLDLEVLIIDEISMLTPVLLDKIEELARLVRDSQIVFGGIQLIFTGDFLQLPCVEGDKFCFESECWSKCIDEVIYLEEIVRQKELEFQTVINKVRYGIVDSSVRDLFDSRLKRNRLDEYKNLEIKPTKFFPLKYMVEEINLKELDKLDGDFYSYKMEIIICDKNIKDKQRAIDKFLKDSSIPEEIQLCVGAQVMLTRNLDISSGLVNGSRGVVVEFIEDFPKVKFFNGVETFIKYECNTLEENGICILTATHLPLIIAYALTIHKSQGATLDCVEIDLSKSFEYGQSYVALSRVKTIEGLYIKDIDYSKIIAHPKAIQFYKKYTTI